MNINSDLWIGLLGGGTFATALAGLFTWRVNSARIRGITSTAHQTDAGTVSQWIENAERQARRIGDLEVRLTAIVATADEQHADMQRQIDLLVERERLQLARVAAHSVWDELMLVKVAALDGTAVLPPPPPLFGEHEADA